MGKQRAHQRKKKKKKKKMNDGLGWVLFTLIVFTGEGRGGSCRKGSGAEGPGPTRTAHCPPPRSHACKGCEQLHRTGSKSSEGEGFRSPPSCRWSTFCWCLPTRGSHTGRPPARWAAEQWAALPLRPAPPPPLPLRCYSRTRSPYRTYWLLCWLLCLLLSASSFSVSVVDGNQSARAEIVLFLDPGNDLSCSLKAPPQLNSSAISFSGFHSQVDICQGIFPICCLFLPPWKFNQETSSGSKLADSRAKHRSEARQEFTRNPPHLSSHHAVEALCQAAAVSSCTAKKQRDQRQTWELGLAYPS